jgi:hypothetical protein
VDQFHRRYGLYHDEFATWAACVAPTEHTSVLLHVLHFLKQYPENFEAAGRGRGASRTLVFNCLERIEAGCLRSMIFDVPVVDHRFYGLCPLIVDGTHIRISPHLASGDWTNDRFFSFKLKAVGLAYQVVFEPWGQRVVHIFGPCPASAHDSRVWFYSGVRSLLPPGIWVMGDGGYRGCDGLTYPWDRAEAGTSVTMREHNRLIRAVRWQVEAFFCRIKKFAAMRSWRHEIGTHRLAFVAVCSVVQTVLQFRPLDVADTWGDVEDVEDEA